ncbi:MAG: SEC-C domain-containing protein [Burkholderiales bacterium]|nr:SEC-C domain-containing protein [Burkholderiales bacterium]MBH2015978.1 SEC-C domain-containing protein [Burkholderiales bacterium]
MRQANEVSYFWDAFIENFAGHIRAGTVALEADKPTATHEQAVRLLAAEGRFSRRFLARLFLEKMAEVPPDRRSSRVCPSPFNEGVCFILVLYPRDPGEDYGHYRQERIELLHAYALVAQHKFPNLKWIALIGTEPQTDQGRSEDLLAIEVRPLSEEESNLAKRVSSEDGILNDVTNIHRSDIMAPGLRPSNLRRVRTKVGRNSPCTCGSGKKWKRCCGAPSRDA